MKYLTYRINDTNVMLIIFITFVHSFIRCEIIFTFLNEKTKYSQSATVESTQKAVKVYMRKGNQKQKNKLRHTLLYLCFYYNYYLFF